LTIGFIAPYNQLQLSLSGLPQSYHSRLNISQQLRSHCNRCNPGNRRTTGSLPLSSLDTNFFFSDSPNSGYQLNSEVYDLWSDCRGDSAFGFGCLAARPEGTRFPGDPGKRVPSGLGPARYQVTFTPRRARHNIF
jgi:hypothetical protein